MTEPPAQQTSRISPEAFSGLLLLASAALALVAANGPWSKLYEGLLGTPLSVAVGAQALEKPLLLWVNDGLMALVILLAMNRFGPRTSWPTCWSDWRCGSSY